MAETFTWLTTAGIAGGLPSMATPYLYTVNVGGDQTMSGATTMAPQPRMVLGKHYRCTDGTDVDGIEVAHDVTCKRAEKNMANSGVLEVAGFTSRARQRPATRTPEWTIHKSQSIPGRRNTEL
ncbi:hypothetical protein BC826DRAFT_1032673, partial [Russula brevipes]